MVQSVRKGGLAKLYAMPKVPLLAGAVTAGDWGGYTQFRHISDNGCVLYKFYTLFRICLLF